MRVFIAIELPEYVRANIFHAFENLKGLGLGRGNFVGKDNIHLTLKFLGELSEEEIENIKKKLSEIKFKKFETETGKIGFFPSEEYIRVIWIELVDKDKDGKIYDLQKIIEDKLEEVGIMKDTREFQTHITIARIKSIKNKQVFLEKVKGINIKKMRFNVENFSLIKSELTRIGPIYRILEKFNLK